MPICPVHHCPAVLIGPVLDRVERLWCAVAENKHIFKPVFIPDGIGEIYVGLEVKHCVVEAQASVHKRQCLTK